MAKLAKSTLPISLDHQTPANGDHSELSLELEQLREAAREWKAERAQLTADLERARALLADSDEAAAIALERQVQTTIDRVRAELTDRAAYLQSQIEDLTRTSRELAAERARLVAELEQARLSLADSDAAAAIALEVQVSTAVERIRAEYKIEIDQLRKVLEGQVQVSGNGVNEHTQLAEELDRARQDLAAAKQQHQTETDGLRHEMEQQLAQNSMHWDKNRAQLTAERDKAQQDLAALKQQLQRALLEAENHSDEYRQILEETQKAAELDKADAVEKVRSELKAEADRLREQMQQQLFQIVTDTRTSMVAEFEHDVVDGEALPASKKAPGVSDAMLAEVARVEALIRSISELIEDEQTDLSVVIRKSAERAELESYLKGIRFSMSEM